MYQGKLPKAPHGRDSQADGDAVDSLRVMTWSDLRARLEAARDLRDSCAEDDDGELASFDPFSARRIAAQVEGKQSVNPTDLANRKDNGCIDDGTRENCTRSPRGSE